MRNLVGELEGVLLDQLPKNAVRRLLNIATRPSCVGLYSGESCNAYVSGDVSRDIMTATAAN